MRFSHDPRKASANRRKHGVSCGDAEAVLQGPLAVTIVDSDAEGEPRFVTIGCGSTGELLVVVWTERGDECRLISARRPTLNERRSYEG